MAELLQGSLHRATDLVARFGGEEFALLLPDVDLHGAWGVGGRVLEAIRQEALPHQDSPVASIVTVSLGLASVHPGMEDAREELLEQADRQLYLAKLSGRNRMSPAPPA